MGGKGGCGVPVCVGYCSVRFGDVEREPVSKLLRFGHFSAGRCCCVCHYGRTFTGTSLGQGDQLLGVLRAVENKLRAFTRTIGGVMLAEAFHSNHSWL